MNSSHENSRRMRVIFEFMGTPEGDDALETNETTSPTCMSFVSSPDFAIKAVPFGLEGGK